MTLLLFLPAVVATTVNSPSLADSYLFFLLLFFCVYSRRFATLLGLDFLSFFFFERQAFSFLLRWTSLRR